SLERGQAEQVVELTEVNTEVHCRLTGLPEGRATRRVIVRFHPLHFRSQDTWRHPFSVSQERSFRSYPFDKSREPPEAIVGRVRGNHKEDGDGKHRRVTPH
ncbi:MAG: hypothetical protein H6Q06_2848, partial [Acidobacteria bacterium]|nr:hypothetical protein [Acidobacteriota bacterium]